MISDVPVRTRRVLALAVVVCTVGACAVAAAGDAAAATTPPTFGPQVDIGGGFGRPQSVAVDGSGDVYVADAYASTIWRIPADGGPNVAIGSGFRSPAGVAVDANGTVYVSDYGNSRLVRVLADGTQSTLPDVSRDVSAPGQLAIDAAGDLFIANTGGHNILELPVGSTTFSSVASNITLPIGVAVDGSGAVYVADASTSGNAVTRYVAGQPPEVLPIAGVQNPTAVALDAQGNVFVANAGDNNVLMYTTAGQTSNVGSGYVDAEGVAVNASGDVIVADSMNHRVTVNPSVDPQAITLTHPIPTASAPGTSVALAASGGGSGNPVTFVVDTGASYPSDTCSVTASGKRLQFTKVGTCVLNVDQAATYRYLAAHRTVKVVVRPAGLASLRVQGSGVQPSMGTDFLLTARGLDAQGNDLGDVTAITTFSTNNGSCTLNSCSWNNAGATIVRGSYGSARGTLAITVALGIFRVSGGAHVTSFDATVGSPVDAMLDAVGGTSNTYTFTRTSGSFPPGVSLGSDGTFSGSPTAAGTYAFTVLVRDASKPGQRGSVSSRFVVADAPPSQ